MSEATYRIRPLAWARQHNMLVAGTHYRIHPAEGDGPHYLEIDGAPNTVESIEAGKQMAWEDWQRRIGATMEADLIADNLRRQCEALVLEREAALARIERVRGYAKQLADKAKKLSLLWQDPGGVIQDRQSQFERIVKELQEIIGDE